MVAPTGSRFPRHICTDCKHIPYSDKNLAQTKKEQGWCYDPTIKYEALRQCAVPRYAYYDDSATDWTDSSDPETEIETVTEEAQAQKDEILAEAKEEQPFSYYPTINYEILKTFYHIDSPDSLAYPNLILGSDPKEELKAKLDKFYCEATLKQIYCNDSKIDNETVLKTESDTKLKMETGSELESGTGTETMAEEKAQKDNILAGAKDEHLLYYEPKIKYEPLKRYIVPRFAFFDSSSTDWSDSSSFSDSESETESMAKKEAESQKDKIFAFYEGKPAEDLAKSHSVSLQSVPAISNPSALV